MTIAVIVACQGKFYLVGDTLTGFGSDTRFTMNNQKVFFSEKHTVAMCISDQANLNGKGEGIEDIYVSHILRGFFKRIDSLDTFQVGSLEAMLGEFVDQNYPIYQNFFKFQSPGSKHEKDVEYFWGGFEDKLPVIFSHSEGINSRASFDSDTPYFSNQSALFKHYLDRGLQGAPAHMSEKAVLIQMLDTYSKYVLDTYIPQTCICINADSIKHDGKYTIGDKLHVVTVSESEVTHRYLEYNAFGQDVDNLGVQDSDPISYTAYQLLKDMVEAKEPIFSPKLTADLTGAIASEPDTV